MTITQTAQRTPPALADRLRTLLEQNRPADALELLAGGGEHGAWVQNARGVCLLRLGRAKDAFKVFRDLVFPGGAFAIPDETPTAFRVNYVTSLLLNGNTTVALTLMDEIHDRQDPGFIRLRDAVRTWKRQLGPVRRALLAIGVVPDAPVALDFPPGEL